MRLPHPASPRGQCLSFACAFAVTAAALLAGVEPAAAQASAARPASETCEALRAELLRHNDAQQARAGALLSAMNDGNRAVQAKMAEARRDAAAGAALSTVTDIAAGALPGVGIAAGLLGSAFGRVRKPEDRAIREAEVKMAEAQKEFAAGLPDMTKGYRFTTEMQARGCLGGGQE